MRQKQNGISAMDLMPILAFGITMAGMKFQSGRMIPFPLMQITLNCAIISLALLESPDVFRAVSML